MNSGLHDHVLDELHLFVDVGRRFDFKEVLHTYVGIAVNRRGVVPRTRDAEPLVHAALEDGETPEQDGLAPAVLHRRNLVGQVPSVTVVCNVSLEEHLGELIAVAVPVEHGVFELDRNKHRFCRMVVQEAVDVFENTLELVASGEPHRKLSVHEHQVIHFGPSGHVVFREPEVEKPHAVEQLGLDRRPLAADGGCRKLETRP